MKLCPHCSHQLEDDAARCTRCGKWAVVGRPKPKARRRTGGVGKKLLLLGALTVLAWVLLSPPEGPTETQDTLELKPSPASVTSLLRSDLETLVGLQGEYFGARGEYSGSPYRLGFEASPGVTVSIIATAGGWSAAATHEEYPSEFGCAVYAGTARPPPSPISPARADAIECSGV